MDEAVSRLIRRCVEHGIDVTSFKKTYPYTGHIETYTPHGAKAINSGYDYFGRGTIHGIIIL